MDAAARTAFYKAEVQAIAPPYVAIAIVVLLFAVATALVRFPTGAAVRPEDEGRSGRFVDVFRQPRLLAAVVAQFFYVGAQVGVWSYTIRYGQANVGLAERDGADALLLSLALFAAGRFLGSALMGRAAPVKLLALFAGISVLLTAVAGLLGGWPGLIALVAASFFMSIQFPTIFALGIEGLGPLRRAGASLIVMAIIGGAGLTALMGLVSDHAGITSAMLVPTASFLVVTIFALLLGRQKEMNR